MKTIKILLIAVLFISAYSASAQWGTNSTAIYNTNTGNVGIGNGSSFTPAYLLDVTKNMTEPTISVHNLGGIGGATFQMIDDAGVGGFWKFKAITGGGFKIRDQASSLDVFTIEKGSIANAIYIKAGGNIGIGTNNPGTTKLAVNGSVSSSALAVSGAITSTSLSVNGKITSKEVEVTLSGWPDYVFDSEYKLKPLSEVEAFIKENKHLPGIKPATEIEKNGLEIGEMNKQLMQKVEELTLYVIQLQKEVDALKNK